METTQRDYQDITVEKKLSATAEIIQRMKNVLNATNFSYCLRNSEHLARYIIEGGWLSLQMQRGGELRGFFDPILEPKHLRLVASLPSDLLAKEASLLVSIPLFDGPEMII